VKREEVVNFSAGPSVLPTEVLEIAGKELLNYNGSGMSVMEMSHRGKAYLEIFESAKSKLRAALSIPESHALLFLQGGASLQFSMVPMNLMRELGKGRADYAVTGNFSEIACKEARRYGVISVAGSSEDRNHTYIPKQPELRLDPAADYFYYCANNTVYGTEWQYVPETGGVPLCCDMSSNILSKPVDVSQYGIIFAGAQKNMAPAGLTVVIIDKDLAGREMACTPLMMSYRTMIEKDSMYNTPPCWNIYILGLVLDWLEKQGGVSGMERIKREKAALLYGYLDGSALFRACAEPESRSDMNVTFRTGSEETDAAFCKNAAAAGFTNLKGHRKVGGMRASIYNAMPVESVRRLVEFMKAFEVKNRV
jgi:phosphoserine aminotransferase